MDIPYLISRKKFAQSTYSFSLPRLLSPSRRPTLVPAAARQTRGGINRGLRHKFRYGSIKVKIMYEICLLIIFLASGARPPRYSPPKATHLAIGGVRAQQRRRGSRSACEGNQKVISWLTKRRWNPLIWHRTPRPIAPPKRLPCIFSLPPIPLGSSLRRRFHLVFDFALSSFFSLSLLRIFSVLLLFSVM